MSKILFAAAMSHVLETKRPVRYLRYADYGLGSITHGLVVNTRSLGDASPQLPDGEGDGPGVGGGRQGPGRRR